jgi:4'-phosphopantetheinyl transferase
MNICDSAFRLETRIVLPEEEVHLWRVELASVAKGEQRWEQILPGDERARAARFHFPRDRQYFTATRAVLRTILAGYAASDPKELVFRYSDNGKPSLSTATSGSRVQCFPFGGRGAAGLRTGTGAGRGCGKGS